MIQHHHLCVTDTTLSAALGALCALLFWTLLLMCVHLQGVFVFLGAFSCSLMVVSCSFFETALHMFMMQQAALRCAVPLLV